MCHRSGLTRKPRKRSTIMYHLQRRAAQSARFQDPQYHPLRERHGSSGGGPMGGKIITAIFELNGQRFMALDGGPIFKFNEAVSFYVECEDQNEVDYFWSRLSAVPDAEQCRWVKDRFGLSWQIVPKQLGELLGSPNRKKALAATNAMLQMKKIVIADLQRAFDQA